MSLTPEVEKSVKAEAAEAQDALVLVREAPLDTAEDTAFFADVLRDTKAKWKRLEEQRKDIVEPINLALKRVNDLFRAPLAHLKTLEDTIKNRLVVAEAAARARAQEALQAAQAAAVKADTPALETALVAHDTAVQAVKADGVQYRTTWHFEVTDPTLVPREYLMVNERALQAVATSLKDSANVPGVKFFSQKNIAVR